MIKKLQSCLPISVVLLFWEWVSRSGIIYAPLFPPPSKVAIGFWGIIQSGDLLLDLEVSLGRLFAGLLLGASMGVALGLLTGRINWARKAFTPIIELLRPLPPVAIIPLIMVWLGIGNMAKIFAIAWGTFFPVWLNTHLGAERVPYAFIWSAELLQTNRLEIFSRIILPAALPMIVAGIRLGIAVAYIMVFVSELSGSSSGLGYRIEISSLAFRIDWMMAALVVLASLGAATDRLFVYGVKRLFPWFSFNT